MNIIKSLLDTDLYKLTMLWVFYLKYKMYYGRYEYRCRSDHDLLPYKDDIKKALDDLCMLRFKSEELDWLRKIPFFTEEFIQFLSTFQLRREYIHVEEKNGKLHIWAEGPIINVMMFEIYVLKIVSGVYTYHNCDLKDNDNAISLLKAKIEKVNEFVEENGGFQFADFGSRRAFNSYHHDEVVRYLKEGLKRKNFNATSNLYLAKKHGLNYVGTHAHEYQSFFQAIVHSMDSVKTSLQVWSDVYKGSLGIALTDTLGVDKFLKDFDLYFAKLFDGIRHDSGCPYSFTDRIVSHYKKLGIDPMTKTIVFSDGLDFQKAFDLYYYCKGKIKCSFGIGTHLTFDVPDVKPVQSVMKLMCAGLKGDLRPICKISDNPAKAMGGSVEHINYVLSLLGW